MFKTLTHVSNANSLSRTTGIAKIDFTDTRGRDLKRM
ncbi:hypothetical protein BMETH_735_1 [methanotrophic bacterial endosymbiont of Bathymodiolus sp.]|nr:hypothetical protein BMETH_735_1 [methanotrophic bacterial endosymbiont of Bathymodiolus sp.]